jgi:hypothetical protein
LGSAEKSIVFLLLHPGSHTEFRAKLRSLNEQKRKFILNIKKLKKLAATTAATIIAFVSIGTVTSAQSNRDHDKDQRKEARRAAKEQKQNAKVELQRARLMQQRQADWARYNNQILATQQRQVTYNTRNNDGVAFVFGTSNWDQTARYRVYRNGSYYNTDYRGAQLLQNAVNEGYRQGFQAGRADRNGNRRFGWSNSGVYRTGTYGYQSHVARNQYQYYFQQGFQRGYQDGSNSRFDNSYNGQYDYGYYENGSVNILGTILNTILNVRSY